MHARPGLHHAGAVRCHHNLAVGCPVADSQSIQAPEGVFDKLVLDLPVRFQEPGVLPCNALRGRVLPLLVHQNSADHVLPSVRHRVHDILVPIQILLHQQLVVDHTVAVKHTQLLADGAADIGLVEAHVDSVGAARLCGLNHYRPPAPLGLPLQNLVHIIGEGLPNSPHLHLPQPFLHVVLVPSALGGLGVIAGEVQGSCQLLGQLDPRLGPREHSNDLELLQLPEGGLQVLVLH
mmetsp:Transcript_6113/g.14651  ORF Transcript_6113/g.14651 Transcript_6113/m.14651 type:complete len:235 (-) Transcript_6113:251-955(-)